MPLRTSEQYKQGLRDGREVYVRGERVADVTTHPGLRIVVEHGANAYDLAQDPELRDLATFVADDGDVCSRYYAPLTSTEALEARSRLIEEHTRRGRTTLNLTKAVGTDALAALTSVSAIVDRAEGTDYAERVARFYEECMHGDKSVVLAQTDVKGDRSREPQDQDDPDLYVHIVERREDGIVVQGAKAHTTMSPVADELIVLPTRAMKESAADYAVAFAIPLSTPGVKMICGPVPDPDASTFENPVSARNIEVETVTVFDRVFVPWERVFLAGEWRHAGTLATMFATYHRFTAVSYRQPIAQLMLGCGVAAAQANGTLGASHVQGKLATLVQYESLLRACVGSASREAVPSDSGWLVPSPIYCNVGKHHFASRFHAVVQIVQDLAGGLLATLPFEADLESPETGPLLRKYLAGAGGMDGEARMRLFHLIRDVTSSEFAGANMVGIIHGEGSMQAQLMQTVREADIAGALDLVSYVLEGELELPRAASTSTLSLLPR